MKPVNYQDGKAVYDKPEDRFSEETHFYAYFTQIKQSFNKKSSYLNPQVICHAHDMPTVQSKLAMLGQQIAFKEEKRQNDAMQENDVQALSPISSMDLEENKFQDGLASDAALRQSKQPVSINLVQQVPPGVKNEQMVMEDDPQNAPAANM